MVVLQENIMNERMFYYEDITGAGRALLIPDRLFSFILLNFREYFCAIVIPFHIKYSN